MLLEAWRAPSGQQQRWSATAHRYTSWPAPILRHLHELVVNLVSPLACWAMFLRYCCLPAAGGRCH